MHTGELAVGRSVEAQNRVLGADGVATQQLYQLLA